MWWLCWWLLCCCVDNCVMFRLSICQCVWLSWSLCQCVYVLTGLYCVLCQCVLMCVDVFCVYVLVLIGLRYWTLTDLTRSPRTAWWNSQQPQKLIPLTSPLPSRNAVCVFQFLVVTFSDKSMFQCELQETPELLLQKSWVSHSFFFLLQDVFLTCHEVLWWVFTCCTFDVLGNYQLLQLDLVPKTLFWQLARIREGHFTWTVGSYSN